MKLRGRQRHRPEFENRKIDLTAAIPVSKKEMVRQLNEVIQDKNDVVMEGSAQRWQHREKKKKPDS